MNQQIYDLCLLYKSELLKFVNLHTDNTLILAHDSFANAGKKKSAKIMIKTRDQRTLTKSIKFNETIIIINSFNNIKFNKKSHTKDITIVKLINTSSTCAKDLIRVNLLSNKQYVVQRAKKCILSIKLSIRGLV